MKVIADNPLGIISSAFYEKCTDLTSMLVINTKDRWRNFDACGNMDKNEYFFEYWSDNLEDTAVDKVSLFAENEVEKEILDRLKFYLQEKEQLQVLFIDDSLIGG